MTNNQQSSSDFNKRLGANVQQFRKAAGMSQGELAKRLSARGLPFQQPTILKVERGSRPLKVQELVPIAYELEVDPCALLDDPEAKITAAMAQLRTATTGIATCNGQIAELEDQRAHYAAMAAEAARQLGATKDAEGRYVWRAADGSRAMHIPQGAPLPPEAVTRPPTTQEERRERAIANLRADAADQSNSNG